MNAKNKLNPSGKVFIQDEFILWHSEDVELVRVRINDIVAIGEYTTADGPLADDWFMVFVCSGGEWYQISRYAENMDEVLKTLSAHFNSDLNTSFLVNSTEFRSIVLYPLVLREKPLFQILDSPTKNNKNFLKKLLVSVGLESQIYFDLSEEIKMLL